MNIEICPSMLSADPSKFGEELSKITYAGADAIHWDVMDGSFVDTITFGSHVVKSCRVLTNLRFDVHLMVCNPEKHIKEFAIAGADTIIVHAETTHHLHKLVADIKSFNKEAGIALNPSTSIDCLRYCDDVDMVVVMSVNPGSSGQAFISSQINKIREIRELYPDLKICVDGGINDLTIQSCIASGAYSFVTGSYLFKSQDYATAINNLKNVENV